MTDRGYDRALRCVLAALAVFFAWRLLAFMPALNIERPELARIARGPAVTTRLARRVIVVIADGLRLDASRGLPYLDRLRAAGVDGDAVSQFPTLSEPNYVAILSGIEPRWSGVRNNGWHLTFRLDMAGAGLAVRFATDHPPPVTIFGPWEYALPAQLETDKSDLLVLVPGTIDHTGHSDGGTSAEYRQAAVGVDRALGALDFDLAHDAVMVVADHGHYERGGHGGLGAEVTRVPLVLAGAGIRRGAAVHGVRLNDVAPTVAALLGVAAPAQATGHTLVDALDVPEATRTALQLEDAARAARLAPVLSAIAASERSAYVSRVWWSAALVLVAAAGFVLLVVAGIRRGAVAGGLAAAIPGAAFVAAYTGAIAVPMLHVVPFHVPGETLSVIAEQASPLVLASIAYAMAITVVIRRSAVDKRARIVRGSALAGIGTTAIPAAVICAVAGDHLATMLPSPGVLMLSAFAAAVAAMHAACGLAVLLLAPRLARYGKVGA